MHVRAGTVGMIAASLSPQALVRHEVRGGLGMRADNWKRLLNEKGCLQGSRIVQPSGHLLGMDFREHSITIDSAASVTFTETFVVDETRKADPHGGTTYFLWEDLTRINLRPWP